MERYTTIEHSGKFEYEDRKSVFIGEAIPVSSEQEAIAFVARIKKKYPDAKHHVYAYVIRENSIMRFSDDREPQGTAGMPILDAIRKNDCTDTAIVVTRYFGGTLLGTGGLVRAYSAAALGALRDANIITYDLYTSLKIIVSYSDYQKITSPLAEIGFFTEDTKYSDSVYISGKVLKVDCDTLISKITQTTSGRCEVKVLGDDFDFLSTNS